MRTTSRELLKPRYYKKERESILIKRIVMGISLSFYPVFIVAIGSSTFVRNHILRGNFIMTVILYFADVALALNLDNNHSGN